MTQKYIKPIMKWAGGKSQLLNELIPRVPEEYNRYIEPFFGGGALFFALEPENAVIADSNPELINMYRMVAERVNDVITELSGYENTEEQFYQVRALDWKNLTSVEAAARTLYLNKTCFNGLYRVNRKGQFNTPYGHYKHPNICDEDNLRKASSALRKAEIICGDYLDVLRKYAQ
ncbi:MAG: DNA adenine methylase, partial [Eubacterium sp.]